VRSGSMKFSGSVIDRPTRPARPRCPPCAPARGRIFATSRRRNQADKRLHKDGMAASGFSGGDRTVPRQRRRHQRSHEHRRAGVTTAGNMLAFTAAVCVANHQKSCPKLNSFSRARPSISIRADTDGSSAMGTAMRTGHYRLPDGSVLRVDFERGRWVGTLFAPSLTIKTQIVGSDAQVHAWATGLAA
jgi:hypothetical protein